MRKLYKSISLISLLLISVTALAARTPRGVVTEIRGNVFITSNGATKKLDVGDYLYDFDEIITELGGQVSFNDYHDHSFHLSGSGNVSVLNKMIELKSGYLWVQSHEKADSHFHIQTINATTSYTHGEFVLSYDNESGKTQLLSIKGTHLFKNNMHDFLKEEVSKGKFSFISEKYENGAPRIPTPIGVTAYSSVLSLYDGIKPMEKRESDLDQVEELQRIETVKTSGGRKIASIASEDKSSGGKIIVIKKEKKRVSTRKAALENMYMKTVSEMAKKYKKRPKKFKPDYQKKSSVAVKIYGKKQRRPASVKKKWSKPAAKISVKKSSKKASIDDGFKSSSKSEE